MFLVTKPRHQGPNDDLGAPSNAHEWAGQNEWDPLQPAIRHATVVVVPLVRTPPGIDGRGRAVVAATAASYNYGGRDGVGVVVAAVSAERSRQHDAVTDCILAPDSRVRSHCHWPYAGGIDLLTTTSALTGGCLGLSGMSLDHQPLALPLLGGIVD
jgi:hypothetical protein